MIDLSFDFPKCTSQKMKQLDVMSVLCAILAKTKKKYFDQIKKFPALCILLTDVIGMLGWEFLLRFFFHFF